MKTLKEYNRKRNFNSTDEPKGIFVSNGKAKTASKNSSNKAAGKSQKAGKAKGKAGGIFVVQHHFARREHFDFRLEHNGVLLSWAVPKGLSQNPADKRLAVHVEDHPLDYANFEGVIPAGNYGAGTVEIFDKGNFTPSYNLDYGMKKGHIKVVLNGEKFKGEYSLIKMDEKNWLIKKSCHTERIMGSPQNNFICFEGEKEQTNLGLQLRTSEQFSKSAVCDAWSVSLCSPKMTARPDTHVERSAGTCHPEHEVPTRTFAVGRIAEGSASTMSKKTNISNDKGDPSTTLRVTSKSYDAQLCTLTTTIPTGKNWAFEIKYDGYRILAFKEGENVKCLTRGKQDYSKKMPAIVDEIKTLKCNAVLDGELVAFDSLGRSDFSLLQEQLKSGGEMSYVVFDLLAINGRDLRSFPLNVRKEMLKNLLKNAPPHLVFSEHIVGSGKRCFAFAKKHNLEGIVAKNLNSAYLGKRNGDWLKIKCYMRQEFVIVGYQVTAKNPILSAILVGFYKDKKLHYAGKVGTGFSEKTRADLFSKLKKIESESHIDVYPQNKKINAHFVRPKYVVEIKFSEFTKEQVLRQPSFVGLRADKNASEVKLEKAERKNEK